MIPEGETASELNELQLITAMRNRGHSVDGAANNFKLSEDGGSVGRESYLTGHSQRIYVANQNDRSCETIMGAKRYRHEFDHSSVESGNHDEETSKVIKHMGPAIFRK